jgi:hypothetical protein
MSRDQKITELKDRIARGEYAVDSGIVAGELIARLRMVRRIRRTLEPKAGGGAAVPARPRSGRERRFRREPGAGPTLDEGHAVRC